MGCSNSKEAEDTPAVGVLRLPVNTTAPVQTHSAPTAETATTTTARSNSTDSDTSHPDTTPVPTMTCSICWESMPEVQQTIRNRPCKSHRLPVCNDCIRKMFLDAYKDETKMPPSCCCPIPLSCGRRLLSADEFILFQEKYEEWGTHDRLYCPVPTCSAFISPRLFPKGKDFAPAYQTAHPVDVQTPPPTPPDESSTVACPKCSVHVCIPCKQLSHPGSPCPRTADIDPELSELLKRWGVKRCPRCRAAVRRMYGCRHMRCRCGAQWCWWCTGPVRVCASRGCEAEAEGEAFEEELNQEAENYLETYGEDHNQERNEEQTPSTRQNNDNPTVTLDAGWHWEDEDLDLGEEPNGEEVLSFNCNHAWDDDSDSDSGDEEDEATGQTHEECGRCWRPLFHRPQGYHYIGVKELLENGELQLTPTDHVPSVGAEDYVNACRRCGIVLCAQCRASTPHVPPPEYDLRADEDSNEEDQIEVAPPEGVEEVDSNQLREGQLDEELTAETTETEQVDESIDDDSQPVEEKNLMHEELGQLAAKRQKATEYSRKWRAANPRREKVNSYDAVR
ncbi:hypothetical protein BGW36DRAFT_464003 [Talaromyces proteolyticus]|uniref:RBR-type E3 ubiquitin transferase n=1 Tax=Talaromyces proteolyticus TaxID=1131652 RepID=A0AAD4KNX5_9EURO|nr:uncharacterized protein BGW36DRAFT_464003 [Talaromyces proteolyticus]KAH8692751.1 hypothetical protein BGW36DRAFT_464003 [Talaromyces proteolyticus]